MVCVARRAGVGAGVTKATKGAGDPPPASGLSAALDQWFEKPFCKLPAKLRRLVDKHFLIPWDKLTPARRRNMAQQWDMQNHPGLDEDTTLLWETKEKIYETGLIASAIPKEKREFNDVKSQEDDLRRLREDEASKEANLQRTAYSLGLCSPGDLAALPPTLPAPTEQVAVDGAAAADPRPKPTDCAVRQWMHERVAAWPDDEPAPNEAEDFAAATAHFAPGLSRYEFRMVRESETPAEWRKQGPRKPWGRVKQSAANLPIRGPQN